jgi:uncharacterized damage-inducible protein DinB
MKSTTLITIAIASLAAPLAAQNAAKPGASAELLAQLDDAAGKLQQLTTAIPQDKFTWRPGTGVRSVSEVYQHVIGTNNEIIASVSGKPTTGISEDGDVAMTDRAQIATQLKNSFGPIRALLQASSDADLGKPITMYGRQTTLRDAFLEAVVHAHEHLGQLIAYARVNGIVPPWSMPQNR